MSKAAIEPVWYLPEIARRFGCTETVLRQSIFRMTNGMYPEVSKHLAVYRVCDIQLVDVLLNQILPVYLYLQLITRPDIKIFLPPIGGLTIYIWGKNILDFSFATG